MGEETGWKMLGGQVLDLGPVAFHHVDVVSSFAIHGGDGVDNSVTGGRPRRQSLGPAAVREAFLVGAIRVDDEQIVVAVGAGVVYHSLEYDPFPVWAYAGVVVAEGEDRFTPLAGPRGIRELGGAGSVLLHDPDLGVTCEGDLVAHPVDVRIVEPGIIQEPLVPPVGIHHVDVQRIPGPREISDLCIIRGPRRIDVHVTVLGEPGELPLRHVECAYLLKGVPANLHRESEDIPR